MRSSIGNQVVASMSALGGGCFVAHKRMIWSLFNVKLQLSPFSTSTRTKRRKMGGTWT